MASLTGLIVFIAAVNGAVDNKLTMSKTKEEAPFNYNYGFSFFFAVLSFLTQELNGICNIYWYVDYYRKYKYDAAEKSAAIARHQGVFQIPTIKVNDMVAGGGGGGETRPPQTRSTSKPELYVNTNAAAGARSSVNSLGGQQTSPKMMIDGILRKHSSGSSSGAVSIGFFVGGGGAGGRSALKTPKDVEAKPSRSAKPVPYSLSPITHINIDVASTRISFSMHRIWDSRLKLSRYSG